MRIYIGTENKKLVGVCCNCCGKKLVVERGIAKEGNAHFSCKWDYFSEKDGEMHSFDLCEECYDQITSQFEIPVEVMEEMILL